MPAIGDLFDYEAPFDSSDSHLRGKFDSMSKDAREKMIATVKGNKPILVRRWTARLIKTDKNGKERKMACGCLMMDGYKITPAFEKKFASQVFTTARIHAWMADLLGDFYGMLGHKSDVGNMAEAYDSWADQQHVLGNDWQPVSYSTRERGYELKMKEQRDSYGNKIYNTDSKGHYTTPKLEEYWVYSEDIRVLTEVGRKRLLYILTVEHPVYA